MNKSVYKDNHVEGNRVLLKIMPSRDKTKSGNIYLPRDAEILHKRAEVVAVGPDVENPRITVGALVVFNANSGAELLIDDEPFLLILQHEVWLSSVK